MFLTDNFERKVLFSLSRWVALIFILILFLPVVLGSIYLIKNLWPQSINVSPNEVSQILNPGDQDMDNNNSNDPTLGNFQSSTTDVIKSQDFPFAIQKNFSNPSDLQTLKGWLEPLSLVERKSFLKELESVIQYAEKEHMDVTKMINTYNRLKHDKINQRENEKNASLRTNEIIAMVIAACIILIAQFSLVLALLAIERNTRKA